MQYSANKDILGAGRRLGSIACPFPIDLPSEQKVWTMLDVLIPFVNTATHAQMRIGQQVGLLVPGLEPETALYPHPT